jgi:hypothetical protein
MKTFIWGGIFIGSTIGGFIPALWGGNAVFSMSSVVLSGVGGLVGLWAGFKVGRMMGL